MFILDVLSVIAFSNTAMQLPGNQRKPFTDQLDNLRKDQACLNSLFLYFDIIVFMYYLLVVIMPVIIFSISSLLKIPLNAI